MPSPFRVDVICVIPYVVHNLVHAGLRFPVLEVRYELGEEDVEAEDLVEGLVLALEVGDDGLQRPVHVDVPGVVKGRVDELVDLPVQRLCHLGVLE